MVGQKFLNKTIDFKNRSGLLEGRAWSRQVIAVLLVSQVVE